VSDGRSGESRENCSSVSQKQSRFVERLLSETVNHIFADKGIFMGPDPKSPSAHVRPVCSPHLNRLPIGLADDPIATALFC
jgi:hypothetical protein